MKKLLGLTLLICFIAMARARASDNHLGLFVEPAVTYERGDTDVNYPSPFSNSSGSADGFGVGARLGFHVADILFLGADARYSKPQFKNSSASYDAHSTAFNWGPVAGVQMPIVGLRVWGSYVAGATLDPDRSNNFDVKYKNGSGYRVGAGFKIAIVSLNLEYQSIKYTQAVLEQIGPFSAASVFNNVELKNKSWIVSVSFPIAL